MSGLIPLRPYQLDGVGRLRQRMLDGVHRLLFVLATGGGKTVVASHLVGCALELGTFTLFVAHRRELIAQAFCKLVRMGIPLDDVGVIMADTPLPKAHAGLFDDGAALPANDADLWRQHGRRRPAARVQVASIDTLRMRAKPRAELIIVDEAHRACAKGYKDLIAAYPDATVLGLTATPYRADGKGLGELFDDLVVIATPKLLVDEGFLVEPEVWTVPASSRPDLSAVRTRGGDYDGAQLARAVDRQELVGDIVEHWQRHAGGLRTVCFACTVEHSKNIAARFVAAGIAAEHLDGETPTIERDAILRRLERGETLVVVNCGVLCEGWDQPSVKCCILARPTKSCGLYLQQAGRILRPWQGARAIILDHAGCVLEHGLPTEDRTFSLAGDPRRAKNAGAAVRECPKCFRVVEPTTPVCPGCGYEFPASSGAPEVTEVAGQLVPTSVARGDADRLAYAAIVADWQKRNERRASPLKPGWCFYQFQKKFNRPPPRDCRPPSLTADQVAARQKFEELQRVATEKGHANGWAHVQAKRELPPLGVALEAAGVAVSFDPEPKSPISPPAKPAPWERRRAPAATVELEEVPF